MWINSRCCFLIFGNWGQRLRRHSAALLGDIALAARAVTLDTPSPSPRDFALDFILFEHAKHREMCGALDRLADCGEFREADIAALADFIRSDLAAHVADEEEVLFPVLLQKCVEDDEVERAIARLDREHDVDRELSAQVRLFLLEAMTKRQALIDIPGATASLRAFAHNQRQHMMLENAVLIPLARRRLSPNDLVDLGRRLAARRDAARRNESR